MALLGEVGYQGQALRFIASPISSSFLLVVLDMIPRLPVSASLPALVVTPLLAVMDSYPFGTRTNSFIYKVLLVMLFYNNRKVIYKERLSQESGGWVSEVLFLSHMA